MLRKKRILADGFQPTVATRVSDSPMPDHLPRRTREIQMLDGIEPTFLAAFGISQRSVAST